jgi:hypothetical protein
MNDEEDPKKAISLTIRESKLNMIKAWAARNEKSVSGICREWILSGLADLHETLQRFDLDQQMLQQQAGYTPEEELDTQPEPTQPKETQDESTGSVGEAVVH